MAVLNVPFRPVNGGKMGHLSLNNYLNIKVRSKIITGCSVPDNIKKNIFVLFSSRILQQCLILRKIITDKEKWLPVFFILF